MKCAECEQWLTVGGEHGICTAVDYPTKADEECLVENIESEGGDDED